MSAGDAPTDARPDARPTAAHRAEFLAVRAVNAAIGRLSWARAGALGARLGLLGYRLGIRRRVVEAQLAAAFPEWPPSRVDEVARDAFAHLGRVFAEAAYMGARDASRLHEVFVDGVDGWAEAGAALAEGRGVIIVAGHLGNWELGGAYVGVQGGAGIDAVARHMANPLVDRYITDSRTRLGITVVPDERAVRHAPRALRDGRLVGFLFDQGVKGLASTFVPFFGRPAKTPRGPAVFALRSGAPVFFAVALRQPDGRYRLSLERVPVASTGDREADVDATVAACSAVLEKWVRRAPGQYFWHHRRWRRQPPGTPAALAEPR